MAYDVSRPAASVSVEGSTVDVFDIGISYDDVIPYLYSPSSSIILCYSVISPTSFEHISSKWIPQLSALSSHTSPPILLLATKSDLRNNQQLIQRLERAGQQPVSEKEGRNLAKLIHASYFEELSLVGEGEEEREEKVKKVFELAAELCFASKKKEKEQGCCVVI